MGLVTGWKKYEGRDKLLEGIMSRPIAGSVNVSDRFAFYSFGLVDYGSEFCSKEG